MKHVFRNCRVDSLLQSSFTSFITNCNRTQVMIIIRMIIMELHLIMAHVQNVNVVVMENRAIIQRASAHAQLKALLVLPVIRYNFRCKTCLN